MFPALIFQGYLLISKGPGPGFSGFLCISKGPGLEFSGTSVYFQGPRPWIFKDFCWFPLGFPRVSIYLHGLTLDFQGFQLFSKVPALDFQRFLVISKGLPWIFKVSCHFQEHEEQDAHVLCCVDKLPPTSGFGWVRPGAPWRPCYLGQATFHYFPKADSDISWYPNGLDIFVSFLGFSSSLRANGLARRPCGRAPTVWHHRVALGWGQR